NHAFHIVCVAATTLSSLAAPLFFFPDPPTPALCPLSLHDALPISRRHGATDGARVGGPPRRADPARRAARRGAGMKRQPIDRYRSEEHTSELQSRENLVCRLLLEKKKFSYQLNDPNPRTPCTKEEK